MSNSQHADAAIVKAGEDAARALMRAFKQRIAESGAIAFRSGLTRKSCVLARGSAARSAWLRGYDAAKKALE